MSQKTRRKRHKNRSTLAMPIRPRQHEIDTEALEHIRSKLPSAWGREEVQSLDYGKDLRVEIFRNTLATGLEFTIQSKGHERFNIVRSDQIAQTLKVSTLNYYEAQRLPVLLVVYSVQDRQACYLWIKPYIREVLDLRKPDWRGQERESEITLHVPLKNIFDKSAHQSIFAHVESEDSTETLTRAAFPSSYQQKPPSRQFTISPRLIHSQILNYLPRPRLTEKLSIVLAEHAVFLHTDAGYGKTWLIHDFIAATRPPHFVWYTFNTEVVGTKQFIEELASEGLRQTKSAGTKTLTYLYDRGREARSDEALAILIEEIRSADFPILLVIEDVHYSNNVISSILESLIRVRPSNLKLILTSRLPLPFGQSKLIADGLLVVIERHEITFPLDETQKYLEKTLNLTLSQEQLQYLQVRTDGWIAAIALAANALREASPDRVNDLFSRLTGFNGEVYDFFAEEVYTRLGDETKWLLKRLGLAHTIQAEVVDLFTKQTDGGQVLKDLAKRNSFLIEDDSKIKGYRFHSLFVEFLNTRFQDEEGTEAVRSAHSLLAHYYSKHHDRYFATQHAIDAKDYELAVQELEVIAPVGVSMGYGRAILDWIEQVPPEWLDQSAKLQEVRGLAALQIGEPSLASEAFNKSQRLYQTKQDEAALNRLEYFIAETKLASGDMQPDAFVRTAHRVALNGYKRNDILFGAQVELRMIGIGQTLTMQFKDLLKQLIERSETLISRLEQFGDQYASIKARAFAAQARLLFQVVLFSFEHSVFNIKIRSDTGHPIPEAERVASARTIVEGWQHISNLYTEAEKITKEKSEIEWALIRLQHVHDRAHHLSMVHLIGSKWGPVQDATQLRALEAQHHEMLQSFLAMLHECAQIFAKYHMIPALAGTYCDMADVCDLLSDFESRNQLAQKALDLAKSKGLVDLVQRSEKLLRNEFTFSALSEQFDKEPNDKELASFDEERKAHFVESFLRAYAGDADIEKMRKAVKTDVDDMVSAAKQRLEWCQHVRIIQDLRHTQSVTTIYRTIPKKRIACVLLGHKSPHEGYSFDELWPMFRGVYCLGCLKRSPEKIT